MKKKDIIKNLVYAIVDDIISDLRNEETDGRYTLIDEVLNAYNTFCKDVRDGAGYIFSLNNKNDLICCLEGEMTSKELARLYDDSQVNTTKYFYWDELSKRYIGIFNEDILITTLCSWMADVVKQIVAYPWVESYKYLYTRYVCGFMIDEKMI